MKIKGLFTVLLLILSITGCLKEDLEDCPDYNVVLHFNYVYRGSGNLFTQRVENVKICIFDIPGNLVATYLKESTDLKSSSVSLKLAPGDYRIVCWGNVLAHTEVMGNNTLSDSRVFHVQRNGGASDNGDPLFYAPRIRNLSNPNADILLVTIPEVGIVEKEIDFTAAHKTVEILVKGFTDNGDMNPIIEFNHIPSGYNFTLNTLPDFLMEYKQTGQYDTRAQAFSVTTFHMPLFELNTPIEMTLIRPTTGAVIHKINLRDYLANNAISLTHGDWDQITILVEFNDLGTVVSIKPWEGSSVNPGV